MSEWHIMFTRNNQRGCTKTTLPLIEQSFWQHQNVFVEMLHVLKQVQDDVGIVSSKSFPCVSSASNRPWTLRDLVCRHCCNICLLRVKYVSSTAICTMTVPYVTNYHKGPLKCLLQMWFSIIQYNHKVLHRDSPQLVWILQSFHANRSKPFARNGFPGPAWYPFR